ncbi:MAG: hypothetical protein ISS36_02875 [Candidatus Aenigmarchaeota archaeon]|nr:hypothetical protein [Candidatus Aenigmarchaeota archaeon]
MPVRFPKEVYVQKRFQGPRNVETETDLFVDGEEFGRYAANWHQKGTRFVKDGYEGPSVATAEHLSGGPMGYNNFLDADAAMGLVREFPNGSAVVIIKHTNPCGAAYYPGSTLQRSVFEHAYEGDTEAAFGGIMALSFPMDDDLVEDVLKKKKFDIIIAPGYTERAIARLKERRGKTVVLRVPNLHLPGRELYETRAIEGGMLTQETDRLTYPEGINNIMDIWGPPFEVEYGGKERTVGFVTEKIPNPDQASLYDFAWKVAKHTKSNAITAARMSGGIMQITGNGAGQMKRINSARLALEMNSNNLQPQVVGSDAFIPFPDVVELAGECGVDGIIQPGGSDGDQKAIDMANEYGMAMLFTGMRHFRH